MGQTFRRFSPERDTSSMRAQGRSSLIGHSMKARFWWLAAPVLAFALGGCRCDPPVKRVPPVLAVSPVALDFGKIKVGDSPTLQLALEAQSKADVAITSVT